MANLLRQTRLLELTNVTDWSPSRSGGGKSGVT